LQPHQSACAARCCIGGADRPDTLADPFTLTLSGWRSLLPPASTQRAQSLPRHACPLYVSISMQVNDCGRVSAPRTSTGRAWLFRSFLRSFTFRQILSLLRSTHSGSANTQWRVKQYAPFVSDFSIRHKTGRFLSSVTGHNFGDVTGHI
jgi:hypothetical protein